ncbi:MAG: hypothetical protein IT518_07390 [Burkholderiales bacterium]|nr:hypothetical protein [Burkholderiales bacterium]
MRREFAIAAVALALAAPAYAQSGGAIVATAPGKAVIAETVKIAASITAIDKANREVTLKGPQGNLVTVTAGSEVKNFEQFRNIAKGDKVEAKFTQAVAIAIEPAKK